MGKGRIKKGFAIAGAIGAIMGGGSHHSNNLDKANYDNAKSLYGYSRREGRERNGRNARNGTNDRNNRRSGTNHWDYRN